MSSLLGTASFEHGSCSPGGTGGVDNKCCQSSPVSSRSCAYNEGSVRGKEPKQLLRSFEGCQVSRVFSDTPLQMRIRNCWRDFAFSFKAWLIFADSGFEAELEQIEKTSDTVFSVPTNAETLQRAHKLYAILSGLLRHRPLRVHKQVIDRNGYETWRQLCQLYAPRTKSRSISLLQALMSFPAFD